MKTYTGSMAFFQGIEGFVPGDIDWLIIRDDTFNYGMKVPKHSRIGKVSVYEFWYMSAEEFINYFLEHPNPSMKVIMFLIPDVIEYIGLTIDMLPRLKPLIDSLDKKHKYIETIYNSYIENGSFTLTNEQLMEAYNIYLSARFKN